MHNYIYIDVIHVTHIHIGTHMLIRIYHTDTRTHACYVCAHTRTPMHAHTHTYTHTQSDNKRKEILQRANRTYKKARIMSIKVLC